MQKTHQEEYQFHHHFLDLSEDDATRLCNFYNRSAAIGNLKPFRNSEIFVPMIHEEFGYVFRVITSFGGDTYSRLARETLLRNLFGSAIDRVVFLDFGSSKRNELELYRDTNFWWIEDLPENANIGHQLGLRSLLIEHDYNAYHICNYPVVADWEQVYNVIRRAETTC